MTSIRVNHQPSGGREWVARITGLDEKFGLAREFLPRTSTSWSSSGKTGNTFFALAEGGIYEVNEPWKGRRFVTVRGGEVVNLPASRIPEMINARSGRTDRAAIMRRAWEIAKKAAWTYGGTSRQYIAEAMKMAWAEIR